MNFEQPQWGEEKVGEIEKNVTENNQDVSKKEEKEFAEYVEKRIEVMKDLKPFLDIIRSEVISPEVRKKIFDGINFLGGVAYDKFDIDSDKKIEIEKETIAKAKAGCEFVAGRKVRVVRTNGAKEDDWQVGGFNPETKTVRILKRDDNGWIHKDIPVEDLRQWNS